MRFRKADNAFVGVADVAALQAAADRLSPALLQRRCAYWVRRLVPTFSPAERTALAPGYRYSMAQMELATDVSRHRLAEADYRLSQLRYDLAKLRAKGLVERLGRTRRYQLTPLGLKRVVLLVKLRIRLLGPLATLVTSSIPRRHRLQTNSVDAAFLEVDTALDHLTAALGLTRAA